MILEFGAHKRKPDQSTCDSPQSRHGSQRRIEFALKFFVPDSQAEPRLCGVTRGVAANTPSSRPPNVEKPGHWPEPVYVTIRIPSLWYHITK